MPITHGLIGRKLGHSFSKKYFTQKFEEESIQAHYELFELAEIDEFPSLWEKHPDLIGLNVTLPYKQEVMPYLDHVLPDAREVGAVNTIKRTSKGLIGYNSDIWGFTEDVQPLWEGKKKPEAALILGTGGAARAVCFALKNMLKIGECCFASRRGERDFLGEKVFGYKELDSLDDKYWELLINTTPLGMYPQVDQAPAIPYEKLTLHVPSYAYDLVYNPEETLFMKLAQQNGAKVRNGMGMLIGQAEKSWEFWQTFQP